MGSSAECIWEPIWGSIGTKCAVLDTGLDALALYAEAVLPSFWLLELEQVVMLDSQHLAQEI
eukprot:4300918-Amphidinium_carterae.1